MFKHGKDTSTPGLPITIAASFLDGLVLSLTPFHNSCNYRSAIVYGYAELVEDADEALYAMKAITDNMLPQRWEKSRVPPSSAEVKSTSILRVRIESVGCLLFASLSPSISLQRYRCSFLLRSLFRANIICVTSGKREDTDRWAQRRQE